MQEHDGLKQKEIGKLKPWFDGEETGTYLLMQHTEFVLQTLPGCAGLLQLLLANNGLSKTQCEERTTVPHNNQRR